MADAARRVAGEAADVHLVDHGFVQTAAQVAVALPIELIIDNNALRRTDDIVLGRQEIARQGLGIRIEQPGPAVESQSLVGLEGSVGLKMVELLRADAGHEDAPNVAPAVQIGIKVDRLGRFRVGRRIIQQHPHCRCPATEHDELHPTIMDNRSIGQGVNKPQCGRTV